MKRFIILLLTVGLAFSLPGIALAQKVGSLTVVQGTVDLIPTGKAAHAAKPGEPVQVGDTVRTRKEGRAEITFDDGTIVRVARSTEMAINQFLIGDKRTDAQIGLPRGKIQSVVPKKIGQAFGQQEANRFEVKTPTATCGVRGTDFFTYHQDGISGATFKEGQGYLYNNNMPDKVSMIAAGQTGTISGPGAAPQIRQATQNEMSGHSNDTGGGNNGSSSNNSGSDSGGEGLAYTPPPPTDDAPPPPPPTPPVVGPITIYIPPPVPTPDPDIITDDYTTISFDIDGTFLGTPGGSLSGSASVAITPPDNGLSVFTSSIINGQHANLSNAWKATFTAEGSSFKAIGSVTGNYWSEGILHGDLVGAWVEINQAVTGLMGGLVAGTYDPSKWQATIAGTLIETQTFLAMVNPDNPTGREQLAALNIPNIEIGRADLTGSNGVFTEAHMNDVTFFSYRGDTAPTIWASGTVGGTIATIDSIPVNPVNQSVALSGLGGAITANLNMQTWNTADSKWAATITNGTATQLLNSTVDVNLTFQGNAAGQITTATTFSGTGSGTSTGTVSQPN